MGNVLVTYNLMLITLAQVSLTVYNEILLLYSLQLISILGYTATLWPTTRAGPPIRPIAALEFGAAF
jgi:hypothetical protein